ncbi:MAG: exodeoxyribonuclease III [Turicibacter sp.]|nr:exodeoxyribonuclease III [Turicibacter sp.]
MSKTYKLGSWNVNGLRACMTKGFMDFFTNENFDLIGLQEIKMQREQGNFEFPGYVEFWNPAQRKGYSGTAVFAKNQPALVEMGIGKEEHDDEGRVITVDCGKFYFVTVYTPNAKRDLTRLEYRMEWEDEFRNYVSNLAKVKGVVICGDLNVAHEEIDLKNPKSNKKNAGFTPEERGKFSELLEAGFIDTFRYVNPQLEGAYTWWSYLNNARTRNVGWRIDYFLVSENLREHIEEVTIYHETLGSDHCPVGLTLRF